jgi:hypothetical protein
MTIEIKQLVIRAVVEPRRPAARPGGASDTPAPRVAPPGRRDAPPAVIAEDRDALVARCVEQVLRVLSRSRQR